MGLLWQGFIKGQAFYAILDEVEGLVDRLESESAKRPLTREERAVTDG